jgi:hypothetical protein
MNFLGDRKVISSEITRRLFRGTQRDHFFPGCPACQQPGSLRRGCGCACVERSSALCNDNPLAEWLEARVEVTGNQGDIVSQAELLELIRARDGGWRDASNHKARKIKEFLKNWCSSKRVYWGDDKYMKGGVKLHQFHGKGIVLRDDS